MKRQILLTVLIIALLGGTITAQGNAERGEKADRDLSVTPTELETTGVVSVTDEGVIIETSTGTYSLSARGGSLMDLDTIDGKTVELEGVLTACADCDEDYDGHIFVASAEIDGTEYDFQMQSRRDGQNRMSGDRNDRRDGDRYDRKDGDRNDRRDDDRYDRRDGDRLGSRSSRGQQEPSRQSRPSRAQGQQKGDRLI